LSIGITIKASSEIFDERNLDEDNQGDDEEADTDYD
jgi:hypothetical protein